MIADLIQRVAIGECRDGDHGSIEWTGRPCSDCVVWAEHILRRIHAAGWRIVRTESVRPTWVERTERIAEEWSP